MLVGHPKWLYAWNWLNVHINIVVWIFLKGHPCYWFYFTEDPAPLGRHFMESSEDGKNSSKASSTHSLAKVNIAIGSSGRASRPDYTAFSKKVGMGLLGCSS